MKNTHLSYRTSNPALNKYTFKSTVKNNSLLLNNTMTIKGTVDKTALSLFLLLAAGYYTFSLGSDGFYWTMIGGIGGFIVAIVTMFKRQWSPITVPIYAILEGLMLGSVSYIYGQMYDGIVFQAICLTIFISVSYTHLTLPTMELV